MPGFDCGEGARKGTVVRRCPLANWTCDRAQARGGSDRPFRPPANDLAQPRTHVGPGHDIVRTSVSATVRPRESGLAPKQTNIGDREASHDLSTLCKIQP